MPSPVMAALPQGVSMASHSWLSLPRLPCLSQLVQYGPLSHIGPLWVLWNLRMRLVPQAFTSEMVVMNDSASPERQRCLLCSLPESRSSCCILLFSLPWHYAQAVVCVSAESDTHSQSTLQFRHHWGNAAKSSAEVWANNLPLNPSECWPGLCTTALVLLTLAIHARFAQHLSYWWGFYFGGDIGLVRLTLQRGRPRHAMMDAVSPLTQMRVPLHPPPPSVPTPLYNHSRGK